MFPERRYHFDTAVDDDWIVEHVEGFGYVYRQRRGVVGVRVRDYDVTHGADLAGAKREPDAATVNREAIVDEEGGQTLELRLWSGAARQKSDSHPRCLRLSHWRPIYYTTKQFSICYFLFAIFYFLFFL
jgi:hypothetical protein